MSPRRLKTIALPGIDDIIILYDATRPGKYSARNVENLVREDAQGRTIWSAQLPQDGPTDSFTDMRLEDGKLIGHTWSCWIVSVRYRDATCVY
jgi:hypothetical protein